jgi:small basic protein (TIGR04137 family)
MSIHRSLKVNSALTRKRNVWTRSERLEVLKKDGRLAESGSVYGLPKVRTQYKAKKRKA